jgi:hypothetical protein
MQRKYQLLRDAAYLEGRESFDQLAVYPTFRDFVALYLAEGCKRNRNRVMVANSDPAVIVVCHRWMGWLTSKKLCYSIAFHADQDVTGLKAFWAQELSIDPDDIYAVRKSNSNQLTARTWRCRYGVVSITTHDTLLRARLQGWIDRLRESWA